MYGDLSCSCKPPASNADLSCVQGVCSSSDTQEWVQWAGDLCAAYGGLVTGSVQASSAPFTMASSPTATSFLTVTQLRSTAGSTASAAFSGATAPATATAVQSPNNSVNPGIIAGSVVGGVVLAAILVALAMYYNRKRRSQPPHSVVASTGTAPAMTAMSNTGSSESAGDEATPAKQSTKLGSGVDSAAISSGKQTEVVEREVESEDANPLSF